jgi:hypothetical protein
MEEKTASVNTSPEEALSVKVVPQPEYLTLGTVGCLTNAAGLTSGTPAAKTSASFGTHLQEAAEIVKDWWQQG